MADVEQQAKTVVSAGEIFLRRLADNGVDYFFANAGTDFAPIIEGIARSATDGFPIPQTLVIPHETAAVGMAHGYYLATGRPQAVMLHTNVGLANAVMGVLNAASDQIPMLVASGITPVVESGRRGHRTSVVAWGQNMRDQAGMLREAVKWDGELAYPEQAAELVDRAFALAMSHPRGPVYLGLPREALCGEASLPAEPPRNVAARVAPDPVALAQAVQLLDTAEHPLILSSRSGEDSEAFARLGAFAEAHAITVIEVAPSSLALSGWSPMHGGFDPAADLAAADVVLVLDTAVPWVPSRQRPTVGAKVIQAGPDPWHLRVPVRGFPADVTLSGTTGDVIEALAALLPRRDRSARSAALTARHEARRAARPGGTGLTAAAASRAIAALAGEEGRVVSELGAQIGAMRFGRPGQYFGSPISGGLGWGLPAALGLQLADRDRLTIATLGDGSYMFANPVACHQIAEALRLPVLTVIFNNGIWNAVRATTLGIYPDGYAARANAVPLTSLEPLPDFCRVAEASRAWTARIESADTLEATLAEAARVVREERRQVLVDIRLQG
jgi:acetolactate synthase-1/2/3 large subunit